MVGESAAGRVVVVHDYLTQRGGAERVVLALLAAFPSARLVTSAYHPARTFPEFERYEVETILPRAVPFARRDPRLVFPVLPLAFARHRVEDADVVVCSSSGWAHGIASSAPKLVYCHTPPRWLYAGDDYLIGQPLPVRGVVRLARRPLRSWDARAAASAAAYVANSTAVAARIRRAYGREARVIHPPVAIDAAGRQQRVEVNGEPFLLTVSRGRGYKNTAAVEEAASLARRRLLVVGGMRRRQEGASVHLGQVSDAELRWLYAHCEALVAGAREDFGLTVVEAMAFGAPVIALRAGGYVDSVVEGITGVFFDEPDPGAIAAVIGSFDRRDFDTEAIRRHAGAFSLERFVAQISAAAAAVRAR